MDYLELKDRKITISIIKEIEGSKKKVSSTSKEPKIIGKVSYALL